MEAQVGQLKKEVDTKNSELMDIETAMARLKNLRSLRGTEDKGRLYQDVQDIKTLLLNGREQNVQNANHKKSNPSLETDIEEQGNLNVKDLQMIIPKEKNKVVEKIQSLSEELEIMEKFAKDY